jgi:hypothetical protein
VQEALIHHGAQYLLLSGSQRRARGRRSANRSIFACFPSRCTIPSLLRLFVLLLQPPLLLLLPGRQGCEGGVQDVFWGDWHAWAG